MTRGSVRRNLLLIFICMTGAALMILSGCRGADFSDASDSFAKINKAIPVSQEVSVARPAQSLSSALPEQSVIEDAFVPDGEDLVLQYMEIVAARARQPAQTADLAPSRGSLLEPGEKKVYKAVRKEIRKIAAGKRTDTMIVVPGSLLLDGKTDFTAEELGIGKAIIGGEFSPEAMEALYGQFDCDYRKIVRALVADLPYSLYWYDSVNTGCRCANVLEGYEGEDVITITMADTDWTHFDREFSCPMLCFGFNVSADYSASGLAGTYSVDPEKTGAARAAAEDARQIVKSCADKTDLEKLDTYRRIICALTDYNYDASQSVGERTLVNPWQLIYVFDGDPDTRVLCAGYSKAFQFLCNLTQFDDPGIKCYTVTGRKNGVRHMWNVIHMDDGNNYIADITCCDIGGNAATDMFLTGYQSVGKNEKQYTYDYAGETNQYLYDHRTRSLYTTEELALSSADYGDVYRQETGEVTEVTPRVELRKSEYTWTGKVIRPEITVYAGDIGPLTPAEYIVSYDGEAIDVGMHRLTVTLKGRFKGSKSVYFKIHAMEASAGK